MKLLRCSVALVTSGCLWAGYQVQFTDTLTSIDSSKWTQNGSLSSGSNGVTGTGSLIAKGSMLSGVDYDVRTTVHTANQGACTGSHSLFARSTPDNSTAYALSISNGSISLFKIVSNSWTVLTWLPYSCADGTLMRLVVRGGDITMWSGGNSFTYHDPAPIATGYPGLGISSIDAMGTVQLGPVDYIVPPAINPASVASSVTPHRVDLRWAQGTDAPNGAGLAGYLVYRDGVYLGTSATPTWLDETVSPGEAGSYSLYAYDQHGNISAPTIVNVSVPGGPSVSSPRAESNLRGITPRLASGPQVDQRRVGVRPTGAYWGAAGEQIDLLSGNLNFTVPLIRAMGRGGWGVTFALSYNSQMWRQDSGGIWLLGEDVGAGLGWKFQAGSIRPVWYSGSVLYYVYSDSTGAEYVLDQNNGGVWSTQEGVYVYFDANTDVLHFPDGSFWNMTVQSGSTEQDAGTRYPSIMEDTNGNTIEIHYGVALYGSGETSSRILRINDARLVCLYGNGCSRMYGDSYNLGYRSGGIPHLNDIASHVGTSENYSFSTTSQALLEPYNLTQYASSVTTLQSITVNGLNISHTFQYASTGEMTQLTTPLGGQLNWVYGTNYYTTRNYREVRTRYMKASPTGAQYQWDINRDSNSNWHGSATVADYGANTQKAWTFSTASDYTAGTTTSYKEIDTSGAVLMEKDFTWTQTLAGSPYVGTLISKLNPDASYAAQTKTVQTLDNYGNLTQSQVYDYPSGGTLTRTFNYSYLNLSNYTAHYIFNRLLTATVTPAVGSPVTLATRLYDAYYCLGSQMTNTSASNNHDPAYDTFFTVRGNATLVSGINSADAVCTIYDSAGIPNFTTDFNGHSANIQTNPDSSYSLPGVVMPNGNSNLQTSATYGSSFAVTSMTGPNGAQGTTSYDSYGRPTQTQIPDGAVTTYTYSYSPPTQTATVNGRWKTSTLDGFGRPTRVQTGNGTTTVSTVDTQYAPCGCSPLGKLWRVSQPYGPTGSPVWTTYTHDGSGRTLTVTAPDGASTTSYAYQGNSTTVTDAARKWKTSTVDAFGNLTLMTEPNPAGGSYTTSYTYTPANQLATVSMTRGTVTQTRTFTYNGADMVSATNPENGTVTYAYDTSHQVTSRTDALGQQTQYDYDTYGRKSEVRYYPTVGSEDTTQRVDYYYDNNAPFATSYPQNGKGRLTAVAFGGGFYGYPDDFHDSYYYLYSYNVAGRVTGQQMVLQSSLYPYYSYTWMTMTAGYQWDNEGRMTSMQYPTVNVQDRPNWVPLTLPTAAYQYDANGRMNGMTWDTGYGGPQPFASATYGAAGEMLTLSYGAGTESRTYNSLLQLTHQVVSGYMDMTYNYSSTQNNGRITGSVDAVAGETTSYTYDSLNRLSSASNGSWSEGYTNDGFGNLTGKAGTGGAPSMTATFDAANHQTGTATYDANGNQTTANNTTNMFNVENRIIVQSSGTWPNASSRYVYDPSGKRVMKRVDPDPWNYNTGSSPSFEFNFYGITGQKLVTVGCSPDPSRPLPTCWVQGENVYFKGKQLVSGGVSVVTDRLGSVRGNTQGEHFSYYPYGEERTSTADGRDKFGTYFRDVAGQDYADQRYYGAGTGRFWTPDPAGMKSVNPRDPLSWNRYAYVFGDPINQTDRHGLNADDDTDDDNGCGWDSDEDCVYIRDGANDGGGGGAGAGLSATVGTTAQLTNISGYVDGDGNLTIDDPRVTQVTTVTVTADAGSVDTSTDQTTMTINYTYQVTGFGYMGQAGNILGAAGQRATHDMNCAGLGGFIAGGSAAASAPIIPKPFSQGGTSGTSVFSTVVGDFGNLGRKVPTPMGMPGTGTFYWKSSSFLGRVVGRWLPYIGVVVGAATTYSCLGSKQ